MKNKYFNNISCPICYSNSYKIKHKSTLKKEDFNITNLVNNFKNSSDNYTKHAQLVKCNKCGLTYTNPMENYSYMINAYMQVVDNEYLDTEQYRKKLLLKHLFSVTRYKKIGKILDVGSFAGYFLELAKTQGWDTYGIEPSKWASDIAQNKGVKLLGKDIFLTKLKSNYFDIITLWDVIEHLPKPHKVILKLKKALKPNGIIAIATPNIESLFARALGNNCPFLIRMHVILYSPDTLSLLLRKNGFEILEVGYYGRTFPLSYLINHFHSKNIILKNFLSVFNRFPKFYNTVVTLNFRDSFRIIARKK